MLKKAIHFVKYNNATVLILAVIFLLSTGVLAQTETGQAVIGQKETRVEGVDNTLLLEADLEVLDMDFKIEKIESDANMRINATPFAEATEVKNDGNIGIKNGADKGYYYVTYTFINLVKQNNAWQYQMQEKVRKISRKLKKDLGVYLAEELSEEYEARIKELKEEQARAQVDGEEKRMEVVEYSGLIGQTLQLAGRVFPGYEPVKKREVPSPGYPTLTLPFVRGGNDTEGRDASQHVPTGEGRADDLTDIYNDYINRKDPDRDDVFGILDNCPNIANPDQADSDGDGVGDACGDEHLNMEAFEHLNIDETDGAGETASEFLAGDSNEAEVDNSSMENTDGADEHLSIDEADGTGETASESPRGDSDGASETVVDQQETATSTAADTTNIAHIDELTDNELSEPVPEPDVTAEEEPNVEIIELP